MYVHLLLVEEQYPRIFRFDVFWNPTAAESIDGGIWHEAVGHEESNVVGLRWYVLVSETRGDICVCPSVCGADLEIWKRLTEVAYQVTIETNDNVFEFSRLNMDRVTSWNNRTSLIIDCTRGILYLRPWWREERWITKKMIKFGNNRTALSLFLPVLRGYFSHVPVVTISLGKAWKAGYQEYRFIADRPSQGQGQPLKQPYFFKCPSIPRWRQETYIHVWKRANTSSTSLSIRNHKDGVEPLNHWTSSAVLLGVPRECFIRCVDDERKQLTTVANKGTWSIESLLMRQYKNRLRHWSNHDTLTLLTPFLGCDGFTLLAYICGTNPIGLACQGPARNT